MGKKAGKTTKHNKAVDREKKQLEAESQEVPRTIIFNEHDVDPNVKRLTNDYKKIFEPYTTKSLKCSKKNVIKDFIDIAGPLNAKTIMYFSQSNNGKNNGQVYLNIINAPRGPKFVFRVVEYTLSNDHQTVTGFTMNENWLMTSPALQLHGFQNPKNHVKAVAEVFQNMLPTLNLTKTNVRNIRRTLVIRRLDDYNDVNELKDRTGEIFLMRHYHIKLENKSINRNLRKLGIGVSSKRQKVPDLSKYVSMEKYMESHNISESEMSDVEGFELNEPIRELSGATGKTGIKLVDIGPQLVLVLIRIEDAVENGTILYHKTMEDDDISKLNKEREVKRKNSAKKEKEREIRREEKLKAMKEKYKKEGNIIDDGDADSEEEEEDIGDDSSNDEAISSDNDDNDDEDSIESPEITDDEKESEGSEIEVESDEDSNLVNYDSDNLLVEEENDKIEVNEVEDEDSKDDFSESDETKPEPTKPQKRKQRSDHSTNSKKRRA